jgi:hypothetical protein
MSKILSPTGTGQQERDRARAAHALADAGDQFIPAAARVRRTARSRW